MAVKNLVVLTALSTENEQTGVSPKTVTVAGTTVSREFSEFSRLLRGAFLLDISAISGTTPTLDVVVKGFNPVSGKWHPVVTFPQQSAVSTVPVAPVIVDLHFLLYRAEWTVAGTTPSITFSLCAMANSEEAIS